MTFDLIVVLGFTLQVVNLYQLGKGRINYLLMIVVYLLFASSEAWVAIEDDRASYWLFVSLSVFGALQGLRGYVRTKWKDLFVRRASKASKVQ